jgi:hypothetical protein
MRKIGLSIVLMLCCSCHHAVSNCHEVRGQRELGKLMDEYLRRDTLNYRSGPPGYDYNFRGPLTISEIEQETLDEVLKMIEAGQGVDMPPLPFGRMNDKWIAFKEQYRPGDELYFFISNEHSWQMTAGRKGYLLLRRNQIIGTLLTGLS